MGQSCGKCEDGCGIVAEEEIELGQHSYTQDLFFSADGVSANVTPESDRAKRLSFPDAKVSYVLPNNLDSDAVATNVGSSVSGGSAPSSTTTSHPSSSTLSTMGNLRVAPHSGGLNFEGIRMPTVTPVTPISRTPVNMTGSHSQLVFGANLMRDVSADTETTEDKKPAPKQDGKGEVGKADLNLNPNPSTPQRKPSSLKRSKGDKKVSTAVYEGDLSASGRKHGKGCVKWSDGRLYRGEFCNDQFHGIGEFCWEDGRRYAGDYMNGRKHGYGVFSWPDGRRYEGQWGKGKRHGRGFYTDGKKFSRYATWESDEPVRWEEEDGL